MAKREREPLEPLLNRDDVRAILRISKSQFYRLVEFGELPALKIGSEWRIEPRNLREFIASRRTRRQTGRRSKYSALVDSSLNEEKS